MAESERSIHDDLNSIEATNEFAAQMDNFKELLEERGWDSVRAQAASIMLFDNILKREIAVMEIDCRKDIAAMEAKSRRGFFR